MLDVKSLTKQMKIFIDKMGATVRHNLAGTPNLAIIKSNNACTVVFPQAVFIGTTSGHFVLASTTISQ